MAAYRAFVMQAGETTILRSHNFEAQDDAEAIARAQDYAGDNDVELWIGETLVRRFMALGKGSR